MKEVLYNSHDVVLIVICYVSLMFAALMFSVGRGSRYNSAFLGGFLLAQACIAFDILIHFGDVFHAWAMANVPSAFYVMGLSYWVEGPLLYFYTRSLIYKPFRFNRIDILLAAPLVFYFAVLIITLFMSNTGDPQPFVHDFRSVVQSSWFVHIRDFVRIFFGCLCLWEIKRYRQGLRQGYSTIGKLDFSWLNMLVIGFLAVHIWVALVSLLSLLPAPVFAVLDLDVLGLLGNYAGLFLISTLLFFGLSHSHVVDRIDRESINTYTSPSEDKRKIYTDEQVQRLLTHMQQKQPYLDNQLKIDDLSKQVSIPVKTLSTIINRHLKKNFFEFVNGYRIDNAKQQLLDQYDKSVMDVMLDAGFNGKATFNSLFKKQVGMTPSQFRAVNTAK